jgi:uncharacterized protein (DUF983 family)
MLEKAELDYEARLDKLQCPKCKAVQSWDQFKKKTRECQASGCQGLKIRFEKLNISSGDFLLI